MAKCLNCVGFCQSIYFDSFSLQPPSPSLKSFLDLPLLDVVNIYLTRSLWQ